MGIAYTETIMPNLLGQQRQDEAGYEAQQYFPLVKIQCSHDLQFFLCSVFVPVCTIIDAPIPPCRALCVSARNGCEGIMNRFQIQWPDYLECSKFPESGGDILCVGQNVTTTSQTPQTNLIETQNSKNSSVSGSRHFPGEQGYSNTPNGFDIGFVCPPQFRIETNINKKRSDRNVQGYSIKVGNRVVKDCGVPCDAFWSHDQMRMARSWVALWSVLCAISCLFTSLTFAIDTHRFRYPERPIIFLSLCYLMVSVSYLIGYLSGNNIACNKQSLITQGTDDNEWCTVLFMVSYFFSTASSVWWVVLTLTWFLAAGLKWGHEAIEANSHYFHLAAWTVPAAKTITVLAMGKIEGK
jgi:frizzled protein 1/7